ncbi:Zinc/RING finger domain-containing protein [Cotesia congregata filamentous virus 1]|uniref:Zinc/RING finger domain-containing protein n=1 Tax=Cotesia congregata filamentous virus 1 TaxID=3064291 RepID=A0ABC8QJG5_9VIRU|nr:Zinc/RING finger domain-containing protein [Cotesia congregata filamentous virus 1]
MDALLDNPLNNTTCLMKSIDKSLFDLFREQDEVTREVNQITELIREPVRLEGLVKLNQIIQLCKLHIKLMLRSNDSQAAATFKELITKQRDELLEKLKNARKEWSLLTYDLEVALKIAWWTIDSVCANCFLSIQPNEGRHAYQINGCGSIVCFKCFVEILTSGLCSCCLDSHRIDKVYWFDFTTKRLVAHEREKWKKNRLYFFECDKPISHFLTFPGSSLAELQDKLTKCNSLMNSLIIDLKLNRTLQFTVWYDNARFGFNTRPLIIYKTRLEAHLANRGRYEQTLLKDPIQTCDQIKETLTSRRSFLITKLKIIDAYRDQLTFLKMAKIDTSENFKISLLLTPCPVCLETIHEKVVVNCSHVLCLPCLERLVERRCPVCRRMIENYRRYTNLTETIVYFT